MERIAKSLDKKIFINSSFVDSPLASTCEFLYGVVITFTQNPLAVSN